MYTLTPEYPTPTNLAAPLVTDRSMLAIRRLIWVYILLLLFEGALRKWFLPFLAAPLLIARDPIALLILFQVAYSRIKLLNPYTLVMFVVTLLSFQFTFYSGHQNPAVALYGFRITAFHFPLIFVIGSALTRKDVEAIGRLFLWLVLPMTVLIALQFYSPQSAWVNRGVGGDISGAGFSGALGFYRPPGTFSFTNGTTLFYSLASVFVFYFWQEPSRKINRIVLVMATMGVAAAIPLSISRGYLFQVVITAAFFFIASLRSGKSVRRLLVLALALPLLLAVLSQFGFFQTGIEAFSRRLTLASHSEGGLEGTIGNRFLGGLFSAITESGELPLWGHGLGLGTNVGSSLLTGGRKFLLAEGEWGRMLGEMGPILGLLAVLVRVALGIHFTIESWRQLIKNNALPWLLISFGLLQMVTANWAQPTSLGFAVLTCGLVIASFNNPLSPAQRPG